MADSSVFSISLLYYSSRMIFRLNKGIFCSLTLQEYSYSNGLYTLSVSSTFATTKLITRTSRRLGFGASNQSHCNSRFSTASLDQISVVPARRCICSKKLFGRFDARNPAVILVKRLAVYNQWLSLSEHVQHPCPFVLVRILPSMICASLHCDITSSQ